MKRILLKSIVLWDLLIFLLFLVSQFFYGQSIYEAGFSILMILILQISIKQQKESEQQELKNKALLFSFNFAVALLVALGIINLVDNINFNNNFFLVANTIIFVQSLYFIFLLIRRK